MKTIKKSQYSTAEHLAMGRKVWDAYHPAYMEFKLKARPDFYEFFINGGIDLPDLAVELAGDINGLKLLDICCAADSTQAFSWENLGAQVTASDISPIAIEITRQNAEKIGSQITFAVADAQELQPFPNEEFDLVYATYYCWFEDIFKAVRAWERVLKPEGRLLLLGPHPLISCLKEEEGTLHIKRDYFDTTPVYSEFTGTPIVDDYGGWERGGPIVKFFHPLADLINAIAEAGLRIERMEEREDADKTCGLPRYIGLVAVKV